eukprot:COSAG01_NODE_32211_length_584_cov_4.113402_1_plen_68_part_10
MRVGPVTITMLCLMTCIHVCASMCIVRARAAPSAAEAAVVGRPLRFGGMPHTVRSAPCTPPAGVARLC